MPTYTSQPDATDGLDTYIFGGAATTNYGTSSQALIGWGAASSQPLRGLLKFDLTKGTNPPPSGAVVTSDGTLTIYCEEYNVARTLAAYECLRDWVEAQATWNIYSTGNNWQTAGAAGALDYDSTEAGSVAVSSTGDKVITIPAALIQKWISVQNYGLVLRHTAETTNYNRYTTSDGGTAGNRPEFSFEYSLGGQFIIWSSD